MGEIVVAVAAGVLLTAAAAYVWLTRVRVPGQQPVFHFRCPGCLRRLRYQPRQVGHKGKCCYCGSMLTFPPISWSLEERGNKQVPSA
jgi:hypothetical protein